MQFRGVVPEERGQGHNPVTITANQVTCTTGAVWTFDLKYASREDYQGGD